MTQVDGMQDSDGERNDIANTLVISREQSKRQGWNRVRQTSCIARTPQPAIIYQSANCTEMEILSGTSEELT